MRGKNDVEVLINGRKYTLCGYETDEYLQKVAMYINGKYSEFRQKDYYTGLDSDLKNILLAINIADDYFKTQKQAKELAVEVELKDKTIFDMKHEILRLKTEIEQLEKQKKPNQGTSNK